MAFELIIDANSKESQLALLDNKELVELHREKTNPEFAVGDIYLGKVKKVIPNLNAAFVDVGYSKDAFLHYLDLGQQYSSASTWVKLVQSKKFNSADLANFRQEEDIDKNGKIKDQLSTGQHILVQIAKEPISTKGPRLTAEITIAGRYLILVPFSSKISISQKITDQKERTRLKRLMQSIKPKGFGVIIRTVAENKKVAQLDSDLLNSYERWKTLHKNLAYAKPVKRVLGEIDKTSVVLRDLLNKEFNTIRVNSAEMAEEIKTYLRKVAPDHEKIVKLYNGKTDIFEFFNVQKQIKSSFGRQVNLPSGGYLIIEHTEAMHVVDVNSGNRKSAEKNQEQNALETNLESAKELARVLRLRDMGGIIVVDFIDMQDRNNQKLLYEKMKEYMKDDRAKHNVLPPSKFGVVEITRQRVRPETNIETTEHCPTCGGTGKVEATLLVPDEIENHLRHIIEERNPRKVEIHCSPFLAAYFKKGLISIERKWRFKYKRPVVFVPNSAMQFLEYHFFDEVQQEIEF